MDDRLVHWRCAHRGSPSTDIARSQRLRDQGRPFDPLGQSKRQARSSPSSDQCRCEPMPPTEQHERHRGLISATVHFKLTLWLRPLGNEGSRHLGAAAPAESGKAGTFDKRATLGPRVGADPDTMSAVELSLGRVSVLAAVPFNRSRGAKPSCDRGAGRWYGSAAARPEQLRARMRSHT